MKREYPYGPLRISGFNNLTKCLSFNLYDFCIARNEAERTAYRSYIAKRFNAEKISDMLRGVCDIIEANVLAVSDQDYEPWGASSMVLMSDLKNENPNDTITSGQSMHLDKSHICAHTYPDFTHEGSICSFRIDIDIATCGQISPLNALNFMFGQMDADVVIVDYVVRGFTRTDDGKHVYMDHRVNSIQDYINKDVLNDYYCYDLVLQSENIFQTKMLRSKLDEDSYFLKPSEVSEEERLRYMNMVKNEMAAVVHMVPPY